MLVSWPYLALALALLWTPLIRCLGRPRRRRLLQAELTHRIAASALVRVSWNWLDLVRAGAGAWVLGHRAVVPLPDPTENPLPAFITWAVVLGVGVLVQAVGNSKHFERLIAPVFYMLGCTLVLLPWQGAVFGGILALVMADMARGWIHLFWLMPTSLAVVLRLYGLLGTAEILIISVWALPALIRLLGRRYKCLWVLAQVRTEEEDERMAAGAKVGRSEGAKEGDGRSPVTGEKLLPGAVRRLDVRDNDQLSVVRSPQLIDDGKRPSRRVGAKRSSGAERS